MYFDVSSNLVIETTLASELRVYLDVDKKVVSDNVLKITIYQIIIPKVSYVVLSSRIVNASASQWHEFDVLKASKTWREFNSSNNGVLITCQTLNNRPKTIHECGLVDFKGSESLNRPFLVSFYQSGDENEILAEQLPDSEANSQIYVNNRRARRSLANDSLSLSLSIPGYAPIKRKDKYMCNRYPLYIGFKDLGWSDWIIAPEGYEAAYCRGHCKFPLDNEMNASNHAIIQTLVHVTMPTDVPEPCCAPLRLKALNVLFLDDRGNVVMKKYADMVVDNCGCQ